MTLWFLKAKSAPSRRTTSYSWYDLVRLYLPDHPVELVSPRPLGALPGQSFTFFVIIFRLLLVLPGKPKVIRLVVFPIHDWRPQFFVPVT